MRSVILLSSIVSLSEACTSIVAGPDTSELGNTFVSHTVDCSKCDHRLAYIPRRKYVTGQRPIPYQELAFPRYVGYDSSPIYYPRKSEGFQFDDVEAIENNNVTLPFNPEQHTRILGYVPVDPNQETHAYYEGEYGLINEVGLSIGESTCAAKLFSTEDNALFGMTILTQMALEFCDTARCAIQLMGDNAFKHGFYGEDPGAPGAGESIQIADGKEAWVFHILSDGDKSAVWVAKRVPNDHLSVLANNFVIRNVTCADENEEMCSSNIVSVAKKNGFLKESENYWVGSNTLDFAQVYGEDVTNFHYIPGFPFMPYYVSGRVWRVMSRVNPALFADIPPRDPKDLPFSIPVPNKISEKFFQDLHRDHYEGTPLDLTKGMTAGPYGNPNRNERGDGLQQNGGQFARAISIPRTTYAWVGASFGRDPQSRGWFAPDTPATSVFMPLYTNGMGQESSVASDAAVLGETAREVNDGVSALITVPDANPEYLIGHSLQIGHKWALDSNSAWWAFNQVANLLELNYRDMNAEVQRYINFYQNKVIPEYQAAGALPSKQAELHDRISQGWAELYKKLHVKYNDGFLNTPQTGLGALIGYPKKYLDWTGVDSAPTPKYVIPIKNPGLIAKPILGMKNEVLEEGIGVLPVSLKAKVDVLTDNSVLTHNSNVNIQDPFQGPGLVRDTALVAGGAVFTIATLYVSRIIRKPSQDNTRYEALI